MQSSYIWYYCSHSNRLSICTVANTERRRYMQSRKQRQVYISLPIPQNLVSAYVRHRSLTSSGVSSSL